MTTTVAILRWPRRHGFPPPGDVGSRVANYLGGFFGWVWLAIIIIPIYYVVITSFKDQGAYFTQNPLGLPNPPTLAAYQSVIEAEIGRYFLKLGDRHHRGRGAARAVQLPGVVRDRPRR